jgi:5-methylcytosine-specific restriction protein A
MRKYRCNHPNCKELLDSRGYCEKHTPLKSDRKPFENAIRYNAAFYNTSQWRKLRKEALAEFPYCAICGISKNDTKLEVHHKIPPRGNEGLFFDKDNLIPLCPLCHKAETQREINNRRQ